MKDVKVYEDWLLDDVVLTDRTTTELKDISIFKDHAEMLEDLADLHDVSVATVIDAILDEMFYNDEEWKDHLDL